MYQQNEVITLDYGHGKKIEATVTPDGKTNLEAIGFKGKACLTETQDIEKALGKVTDRKLKKEFNKKERVAAPKMKSRR